MGNVLVGWISACLIVLVLVAYAFLCVSNKAERTILCVFALALALALALAVWRSLATERERGEARQVAQPASTALPALRCLNGDPPRVWSRLDAEAAYHAAKMHQQTAEAKGLWTDLGRRALQMATVQYLEILVCWPGGGSR